MSESDIELLNIEELLEHRENEFSKLVALVTAIFAVILAISSLGGSEAMKDTILTQQQASDQWAHYQAKSIRENIYQAQAILIEAQISAQQKTMTDDSKAVYTNLLTTIKKDVNRYKSDKSSIEKEARSLEKERDISRKKNIYFEYGSVLLQIAIVLSSISILAKSRNSFYFAVIIAIIGTILAMNGFFLVFKIPFM